MGTGSRDKVGTHAGGGGPVTPPLERPLCKCHGEPMVRPSGWTCAIKSREWNRRDKKANPEKARERSRRFYEANREKVREWNRRYREANREKVLEKQRERNRRYREANPVREDNARRVYVGEMYLGMGGFTKREREEMLRGSSD